jgi:hypothetical protein
MKKRNVLPLLIVCRIGLFSRHESTTRNLRLISESEKATCHRLKAPQKPLITNNYD